MTGRHQQDAVEKIVKQIRADLPDAPQGMSQDEFSRLCDNIARAITVAIRDHENRYHQIRPEFGEPQRPEE